MLNSQVYAWKDIPRSSHQILQDWITDYSEGFRILEVGSCQGELGRRIRPHCDYLVGIEPNNVFAQAAVPHYDRLLSRPVEECLEKFEGCFDLVIFADVLEHLVDPWLVMAKARNLLTYRGRVIISVPNVANISVRTHLALGNFDYTPRGLLDCGHLRFFTKKTAEKMITEAGFDISRVATSDMPLELRFPDWENRYSKSLLRGLAGLLTRVSPTVFGYQFIFECFLNKSYKTIDQA